MSDNLCYVFIEIIILQNLPILFLDFPRKIFRIDAEV